MPTSIESFVCFTLVLEELDPHIMKEETRRRRPILHDQEI